MEPEKRTLVSDPGMPREQIDKALWDLATDSMVSVHGLGQDRMLLALIRASAGHRTCMEYINQHYRNLSAPISKALDRWFKANRA